LQARLAFSGRFSQYAAHEANGSYQGKEKIECGAYIALQSERKDRERRERQPNYCDLETGKFTIVARVALRRGAELSP